ncbi:hypothetical protein Ahy_A08g038137 [Arachis hypogaea]|uniref:Transposase MuDR plant domain-containing protein n=1 Tax=Arachis hypogaea TaxID=3818 RepID=A0A445BSP7_ARAHY|nr:hypothetical protein Ahy_A08g038137 [Arachis hypogaea]
MENDILRRVNNILYRNLVIVFGGLIHFDIMSIIDETSMQNMFHIHWQTQVRQLKIELYVKFENIEEDGIQHNSDVENDRANVYERMNSDSEEDFKATYEADDEHENGDVGGVADPKDSEFRIRLEYSSRKSVVTAIRSYTIIRGVDYNVYESELQTFYAKYKTYGHGYDWLI